MSTQQIAATKFLRKPRSLSMVQRVQKVEKLKNVDRAVLTPTEFKELGRDLRIETIQNPEDPTKTALAIWQGGEMHIAERFSLDGQMFVPKDRITGMFRHTHLPSGIIEHESVGSLFDRTMRLVRDCVEIDDDAAKLISAFVMSTWCSEKLPVAPYLALVGMPGSGKTTMLRLLNIICRHSIFVSDISAAGFYQAYEGETIPTLLIDETGTAADQKKLFHLLRAGSTPGTIALRRGAAFNSFGPKVTVFLELPNDPALVSRCVVIPFLESTRTDLKKVESPEVQLEAMDLQKMLLHFRLSRFGTLVPAKGAPQLCSRNRDLFEALVLAIAEDKRLSAELLSAFAGQEEFTREPLSVRQNAVLAVLVVVVHALKLSEISVGDLAKLANQFLSANGEKVRLKPHAVGRVLNSFGIKRSGRRNWGYFLELGQKLNTNVHQLAKRYGVECGATQPWIRADAVGSILRHCQTCKELGLLEWPLLQRAIEKI